jgi:sporulation protein YlmC with PRC-barrel domain
MSDPDPREPAMGSRADVSFYRDVLHKPVVDCDGRRVGVVLDVAAGPSIPSAQASTVQRLVVRPYRRHRAEAGAAPALILAWEVVEALEPRRIRLRHARADLSPSPLEAGQVLLKKHVMDQQLVDCRGRKVQRVNDVAMGLSDGRLHLCGMDTGIRGFLTRLDDRWGLLALLRPITKRLDPHLISWNLVERVEPARGHIRLRLPSEAIRIAARQSPQAAD